MCYIAIEGLFLDRYIQGEVDTMFRPISISRIMKGGETMKILGLVLALSLVMAGACVADTVTMNIYTGWNIYALPIAPYDGSPSNIFGNVFAQYTAPAGAVNCLSTMDLGNGFPYDPGYPAGFGSILLGQGYWLRPKAATSISFTGFPDGLNTGGADPTLTETDMWISLPGNGGSGGAWHMIGQPFNHDTKVTDLDGTDPVIQFTNGTDVKSWPQAVAANWVYNTAYGADPAFGGQFRVSYEPSLSETDTFMAKHGYQIRTKLPNLAMIIHAHPIH